jgi:hypothetical protein
MVYAVRSERRQRLTIAASGTTGSLRLEAVAWVRSPLLVLPSGGSSHEEAIHDGGGSPSRRDGVTIPRSRTLASPQPLSPPTQALLLFQCLHPAHLQPVLSVMIESHNSCHRPVPPRHFVLLHTNMHPSCIRICFAVWPFRHSVLRSSFVQYNRRFGTVMRRSNRYGDNECCWQADQREGSGDGTVVQWYRSAACDGVKMAVRAECGVWPGMQGGGRVME